MTMTTVAAPIPAHAPPESTTAPARKKKSRSERKKAQREVAAAEKLKIVVRRLPPNLPEDIFWQSVQPWVTDETSTWKKFHAGKTTKKPVKLARLFRDCTDVVD